jgi:superfamily I DNA/RNA helicase
MIPPRQLTPDQIAAVQCPERVCFVLAPAGSGKTEVLIRRVIRVLDESPGQSFRVLTVTFTLKAADELRQRVDQTVGEEAWRVDADTIHGFALDWLQRYGSPVGIGPDVVVYAERADRFAVLHRYFETLGEPLPDEQELAAILDHIDQLRTDLVPAEDVPDTLLPATNLRLPDIYEAYLIALDSANGIDFPGMLSKFIELMEADPSVTRRFRRAYHHVFVDEGQDLTKAQAKLLRRLVGDELQLFVVGDARQSIQGWAGGGIQWARLLVGDNPRELHLGHNFRCATRILELAGGLARNFAKRQSDATAPPGSPPGSIRVLSAANESAEAAAVADWIEDLDQWARSEHSREGRITKRCAGGDRRDREDPLHA